MSDNRLETSENQLLAAMPAEVMERLAPQLQQAILPPQEILHNFNDDVTDLYFPNRNTVVSTLAKTDEGIIMEVGLTGNEGFVGMGGLMGFSVSPHQNLVQVPGTGSKLPVAAAVEELNRGGRFKELLLRFAYVFLIQVAQVALCNRVHTDEERLARWLLVSQDRIDSNQLPLPRELLAKMLGRNLSGVSVTAAILQSAGLISYNGAEMTIANREALENVACSCYWMVKRHYHNLFVSAAGPLK